MRNIPVKNGKTRLVAGQTGPEGQKGSPGNSGGSIGKGDVQQQKIVGILLLGDAAFDHRGSVADDLSVPVDHFGIHGPIKLSFRRVAGHWVVLRYKAAEMRKDGQGIGVRLHGTHIIPPGPITKIENSKTLHRINGTIHHVEIIFCVPHKVPIPIGVVTKVTVDRFGMGARELRGIKKIGQISIGRKIEQHVDAVLTCVTDFSVHSKCVGSVQWLACLADGRDGQCPINSSQPQFVVRGGDRLGGGRDWCGGSWDSCGWGGCARTLRAAKEDCHQKQQRCQNTNFFHIESSFLTIRNQRGSDFLMCK